MCVGGGLLAEEEEYTEVGILVLEAEEETTTLCGLERLEVMDASSSEITEISVKSTIIRPEDRGAILIVCRRLV
jgi:hypothetical protein